MWRDAAAGQRRLSKPAADRPKLPDQGRGGVYRADGGKPCSAWLESAAPAWPAKERRRPGKRGRAVITGCAIRILKWTLGILFLMLAPKLLRKARRRGKKAADRTRVTVPKRVKKMRRAARRSIAPKRRRTLPW